MLSGDKIDKQKQRWNKPVWWFTLSGACNHWHSDDVWGCSTLLDRLSRPEKGGALRQGLQPIAPSDWPERALVVPRQNSGSVMASLAAGSLAFLTVFGLCALSVPLFFALLHHWFLLVLLSHAVEATRPAERIGKILKSLV